MAWIPNKQIQVGSKVKTTRVLENFAGKFEKGTILTVTAIGNRGYDVEDEYGHRVTECGYDSLKIVEE